MQVARYYSSQESAVEKQIKYSLCPSEKSLLCLETCCLKNEQKKKQKKTTTATISVGCVKPFCFSAFRPYFCAVAQCNTVGNSHIPLPKYGLSGVVVD